MRRNSEYRARARRRLSAATLLALSSILLVIVSSVAATPPSEPAETEGPANRERPPRVVQTTPSASSASHGPVAPASERSAEPAAEPGDWWPYALRPPFGGLDAAPGRDESAIMVGNAAFTLASGPPAIPEELSDPRPAGEGGGYFVVRLGSPLSVEAIQMLRAAGVEPIRYLPRKSYLMRVPSGGVERLAELVVVEGLFRYEAAYKISPRIGERSLPATTLARRGGEELHLRVSVFPGEDPSRVAETLRGFGVEIFHTSPAAPMESRKLADGRLKAPRPAYVEVGLPWVAAGQLLPSIARLEAVRWIEEVATYRSASDWTVSGWDYGDSRSAGSDFLSVRQPWNNGLHGEGVLLGNVDTGADFDHLYLADPVSPGVPQESPPTQACSGGGPKNSPKVPYYHLAPPTDLLTPVCYDQTSEASSGNLLGHGTATSGLIAADPIASSSASIDLSSGTAPEAQIWIYDVGPASGNDLALEPAALSAELERMGQAGVAAVNLPVVNGSADGLYDILAELLDAAAWDQPGLLPVQAAGNDGASSGPKSYGSIDSNGKNVLSVGGNLDESPNDLYAFSSRGDTEDGRRKPDIISPAANNIHDPDADPEMDETLLLLSSDGDILTGNAGFMEGPEGTSFSCASVTGLAGVAAQYFQEGFYPSGVANVADAFAPRGDLLKAVLINSALRMTGANVEDDARPGKDQGWGRVKLADPLYFSADPDTGDDARRLVVYGGSFPQGASSCPGDSEIFTFELFNEEEDLRVTLAWTDFPGDHTAPTATQLVNDLDLIVEGPLGTVWVGNDFDGTGTGYSITGGSADRVDNVENVWLASGESLETGVYTVEICPYAINDGAKQDFSLLITGGVKAGEKLRFDQLGYTCQDTMGVELRDIDETAPSVDVTVTSLTSGDSETLTLNPTGATGTYAGSLTTTADTGSPIPDDGVLEVADGETINVSYLATSDSVLIDCTPAVCFAEDLGALLRHECDNDGFADEDEAIHLYVPLRNGAAFPVDLALARLGSGNVHVSVDQDTSTYGTLTPGVVAWPEEDGTDDPFMITVSGAACDEPATLSLTTIEGTGWTASGCGTSDIDLRLNRDPVPLQVWDFDDGTPQGWTHEMSHGSTPGRECAETYFDEWNTFPTTQRAHSGSYAMQLGDNPYRTFIDAGLLSPSLDVPPEGARLRFYYWMEADVYDDSQVWHGFIIEASTDGGATWTQLNPEGGHNAVAARNDCAFFFPFGNTAPSFLELLGGDGPGTLYTGDTFDREWVVDLGSYASQTIQIRFRFGSDDYSSTAEGLYIDTITLEGFVCETTNICDDGEKCTTDTCDAGAGGCQYQPATDGTSCDDGEACTGSDECTGGVCGGGDLISCDDGNVCTDDRAEDDGDGTCDDPVLDCRNENNNQPCDDGDACTSEDICDAGGCTAGPAIVCSDQNPCTDDSCAPATGCVFTNNTDACNDGSSCTENDVCSGGQCSGVPADLNCDDTNVCTIDTCDPGDPGAGLDGCVHPAVPDGSACDDQSVCTENDGCQAGLCTGDAVDCADAADCTHDLCDAVDGCSNPGIDGDEDGYDICGAGDPVNPDGFVKDCDDFNADINPGAEEDCFNNQDDDCNGLADEADTAGCPRSDINGTIVYYRGTGGVEPGTEPVPGVTLDMIGTETGTATSDAAGYYELLDILKGQVSVTPSKLGDFGNGISSLDASRISQHRVGIITLSTRQQVAGDVSGNGTISSYDASLISQFRVGIITRFPVALQKGSDWSFEPEQRHYAPIDTDRIGENYLGVLYGDVTGNWYPPAGLMSAAGEAAGGAASGGAGEDVAGEPCVLSIRPAGPADPRTRRRLYELYATGGNGILGLDIDLGYASQSLSFISVSTTDRTSHLTLTTNDAGGLLRIALHGSLPFTGNGPLLEFAVDERVPVGPDGFSLTLLANEGQMECSYGSPGRLGERREVRKLGR